jgi:hypothetical protein
MGNQLQSYDQSGPMIHLGEIRLWMQHDPLGISQDERYDFTAELWQHAETQSQAIVRAPGRERPIKTGSTFNDFYGFGTSRDEAISQAESFATQFAGANLEISVVTTLTLTPVIHDLKTPAFYNGAVRAFALPLSRWFVTETGQSLKNEHAREETWAIWRDGSATADAADLQQRLDQLRAADGAAHIRKGGLR